MTETPSARPVILLVDDNPHDVVLIRLAFRKVGIIDAIHLVKDGTEAMRYVAGDGVYADRRIFPPPTLVLLDLKMPGANGFEVLKWIRLQPGLRTLRVIVLTSSGEMHDVNLAYLLGANSFLEKPADFARFVSVVQSIQGYWLWMSATPDLHAPQTESCNGVKA